MNFMTWLGFMAIVLLLFIGTLYMAELGGTPMRGWLFGAAFMMAVAGINKAYEDEIDKEEGE